MLRALICASLLNLVLSVDMETILTNTNGYKLDTKVTYLIAVPRKIRPNQVIQIFTTITRLEYGPIILKLSIVRDKFEYGRTTLEFNMPASRIMQLQISQNLPSGQYKVKVEANPISNQNSYVFTREADILFDEKFASVFIQTNKPVYCQGQTVHFRVVQVYPDLMPVYGSVTIYVKDPTGFVVRRWLGQQTNAGGIVSETFELADQPKYGNWSIAVHASSIVNEHYFRVEEFWTPRFDVNVTVSPYFMDDVNSINGVIMANHTSGKATIGSATIKLTIVPPSQTYRYNRTNDHLPSLQKNVEYFNGRIGFRFEMSEIHQQMKRKMFNLLKGSELVFNVTVFDWFLSMSQNGSATSHCFSSRIKLQWVGDIVRSFKPNTHVSVTLALMKQDGSRVNDERKKVNLAIGVKDLNGRSSPYRTESKTPVKGFVTFDLNVGNDIEIITFTASYEDSEDVKLIASRYFSESQTYVSVTTSTKNPMVNEFMVFHVKTSTYVEKVFYQIIAKGNILLGDELLMGSSRQKTFSVALSRRMVPTARIVVYFIRSADQEVVVDVLNFFIDGAANNEVRATFNRGKDFTRDTIEINAYADPGSYVAFAAVPYDLYIRGMGAGITQNQLIDELYTYDEPANTTYRHLWRVNEAEYKYVFFSANGYGMDASSTFMRAGLLILTDANVTHKTNTCNVDPYFYPCFLSGCYSAEQRCNKKFDCADGADEQECKYETEEKLITDIDRVSRIQRFYDDSSWIWQEYFVKPDGRVDFRIKTPKYPLTWVMHGLSINRDLGLGIMSKPVMYDASRYMYIQVEAPTYIIRGEQVGFRVTVFNFWDQDDFIEVLVTAHASPNHKFVLVGELGLVQSYSPDLADGDLQTIVFLEPGQSKDIYMPVIPTIQNGCFNVEISASCFMERDYVLHRVCVKSDGVLNYYHIPYMVDLITQASVIVPNFDIPISAQFIQPEQREHDYVPGSGKAASYIFGDVVTPGFFDEYLNAENILYRPYGVAENIVFNFAYNVLTLKFKKASMQLSDETLRTTLKHLNVAMQRILSYMNEDGSFSMSRDHRKKSIWLTAFVVKTLDSAREGEWERDLFIPLELINKMITWIWSQQNSSGVFDTEHTVYDRKMSARTTWQNSFLQMDPIALTAYVYISLFSISRVSNKAVTTRKNAAQYLSQNAKIIKDEDIFTLAITTYALSLSNQKSASIYKRLWDLHQGDEQKYFSEADRPIIANPSTTADNIRYLQPRVEQINEAFSVQTTAYALLAHIKLDKSKENRDSLMKWLNSMRNTVGGMSSTQDTIIAMEALYEYTQVDPNRNVFNMKLDVWSVANNNSKKLVYMTKKNYTHMSVVQVQPNVYSYVRAQVLGTGRAMFQVTSTVNVEYEKQLKQNTETNQIFEIKIDQLHFSGRNDSIMDMTICVSWKFESWSQVSGMSVLEIDIPTGYVILNSTLRQYVQSGIVPNLMRAESYNRKIVYYFESLDKSSSCVYFRANRWYPVANATIQHRIRVYDYYEPGLYLTSLYKTDNLFQLNICYVCGSFQCPYCPQFNAANIIKCTIAIFCLLLSNLLQHYMLRTS